MRIDGEGAPKEILRFEVVILAVLVMVPHSTLIEFVCVLVLLRPPHNAVALEFEEFGLDGANDRSDDLVLYIEQVGELAIVPLRAQMMTGISLDQLPRDTYPAARFTNAALKDIARPQLPSDHLDVNGLPLEREGRAAGYHRERAPAGEHRNDIVGHAVGKILLLGVTRHVLERQHCDRRSFW